MNKWKPNDEEIGVGRVRSQSRQKDNYNKSTGGASTPRKTSPSANFPVHEYSHNMGPLFFATKRAGV